MKKQLHNILAAILVCLWITACSAPAGCPAETPITPSPAPDLPNAVDRLHWFGQASVLYSGSKAIYFDVENLSGPVPPAGFILLSHAHHVDLESILKVIRADTALVISPNVVDTYDLFKDRINVAATVLDEGETLEADGVVIQAVAAYDDTIHPRSNKGMGYVVTIDGERIYFAGGTRYYPEMAQIESDVALYPLYDAEDALQTAKILPTRVLIPIHCNPKDVASFQAEYGETIEKLSIVGLLLESYNP